MGKAKKQTIDDRNNWLNHVSDMQEFNDTFEVICSCGGNFVVQTLFGCAKCTQEEGDRQEQELLSTPVHKLGI